MRTRDFNILIFACLATVVTATARMGLVEQSVLPIGSTTRRADFQRARATDRQPAWQTASRSTSRTATLTQESRREQQRTRMEGAAATPPESPSPAPPFLLRPVLFEPNSARLTQGHRKLLRRSAVWLRQQPQSRVLIVGFCDSDSELCTHQLAMRRSVVVSRVLSVYGLAKTQVTAVKAWERFPSSCEAPSERCRRLNRSAGIFLASSKP